ncbi:hypothetical protein CCGE531_01890 [Rhizobium sp. CCGE531]|nr:hypothetical protein CCGE531_01890 [Rhizobium sp. CCGE531]AYG71363.1 hypothetical protein CCGE532_01880 [Rhizobium sp. CCGE532]
MTPPNESFGGFFMPGGHQGGGWQAGLLSRRLPHSAKPDEAQENLAGTPTAQEHLATAPVIA